MIDQLSNLQYQIYDYITDSAKNTVSEYLMVYLMILVVMAQLELWLLLTKEDSSSNTVIRNSLFIYS